MCINETLVLWPPVSEPMSELSLPAVTGTSTKKHDGLLVAVGITITDSTPFDPHTSTKHLSTPIYFILYRYLELGTMEIPNFPDMSEGASS